MKKVIMLLLFFLFPCIVYGSEPTVKILSPKEAVAGEDVYFYINIYGMDWASLKYEGNGFTTDCTGTIEGVNGESAFPLKTNYKITCKATTKGTIKFTVFGKYMSGGSTKGKDISISKEIPVVLDSESDINKLSSLTINSNTIKVDRSNYSYSVNVDYSVSSVKINATAIDGDFTNITGTGEFKLKVGTNKFNIVCDNGASRPTDEAPSPANTYEITINRKDQSITSEVKEEQTTASNESQKKETTKKNTTSSGQTTQDEKNQSEVTESNEETETKESNEVVETEEKAVEDVFEEKQNDEKTKSNKGLIITIMILGITSVCSIGYIIFTKIKKK